MKHIKRLFIITVTVLALAGCATKHIAYHYKEVSVKKQRQSAPLWLPRTVIEFRAMCEMETATASPLHAEALKDEKKRRFDLKQLEAAAKLIEAEVATNNSKTIKLKETVLGVKGERDPEQLFYAYLDNALLTAVDFEAEYAPDGVIGSVSSTRQNQALEFTLKTLESVATIAGNLIKIAVVPPDVESEEPPVPKENVPNNLAQKILKIRQHRTDLRFKSAERAGLDGAGLGRLLDDLDKEEAPLLAQFSGKTKTLTTPVTITIRPERSRVVSQIVLAEFDTDGGFGANGSDGRAVVRSAVPPEFLGRSGTNEAKLVLNFAPRDIKEREILAIMERVISTTGANGLPYQVPAQFSVSVSHVGTKGKQTDLLTTELLVGQWGVISRLPVSMGTPGSTLKPVYYTETGALKKLTVASKPPATDSAKSLGTAAGTITDAVKAREDANSGIGQLKKLKEKLELEVAIKKAQDELNKTNTASTGGGNP